MSFSRLNLKFAVWIRCEYWDDMTNDDSNNKKGKATKLSREERLAQNLRANLRRRKQVAKKRKVSDSPNKT